MAKVDFAFKTTARNEFQRKVDSLGRTYYVQKGEGRISAKAFAGANQSLYRVMTQTDDGEVPQVIQDATTAQDYEDATQVPFTSDVLFQTAEADESGGKAQALKAERNRFLGFWRRQTDDPDRDEAVERYLEFRDEIADVESAPARAVIKDRYNIGGS